MKLHPNPLAVLMAALAVSSASAGTTVSFTPTRAASGVSWAPGYSIPVNEGGTLGIGALDNGGSPFLTAALLGYQVSSLAGLYASIDSVTLTATVKDGYGGAGTGMVELFRVGDSHAPWTSSATWGDSGSGPWAGGATMGTVETGAALASAAVTRNSPVGTVYAWTITGAAAQTLIDDWITGTNAGLALADTGTGGGVDYRSNIGGIQGAVPQPTLAVTYTAIPEPAGGMLALAAGGLALRRRREGRAAPTPPASWPARGGANERS
jgi:hypothetical protein